MSTATLTYSNNNQSPNLFKIILWIAIAAGLVVCAHALQHSLANKILNCPENNTVLRLVNPITGRKAWICEYEPGQFGRIIICKDGSKCITAYASKNRPAMNTLEVAIRHIKSGGYTEIEFIRPDMMDAIAKILSGMP